MEARAPVLPSTIGDLSRLQDSILQRQADYDQKKRELEELGGLLEADKRKMIEFMTEANLTNFKTPRGQIVLNRKFTVPTPKGDDLDIFLGSLAPEVARTLRTVNYQTLNSWYKTEMENAKERGDFDWRPPGLQEPTVQEYLSVRRA